MTFSLAFLTWLLVLCVCAFSYWNTVTKSFKIITSSKKNNQVLGGIFGGGGNLEFV